jgi:ABC-2 type transport system ATP-binding protein
MRDPIVVIKDFKKYYDDFLAVDMEYLDVFPGEILAILGPNGAGKTTTLETLEGLRNPSSGELTIKGYNVETDYQKIRPIIGVQLQSQSLQSNITVIEAMELFCSYYKVKPRYELLERFNLHELKNRQFSKLSVGQQRKLSLAIAIAHNPEVLILDEPTAGLDVIAKAELHDILTELRNQGTAIILSSHDMFEVDKLADRIAILFKGKIIKIGTPLEIKNTYDLIKVSVKTQQNSLVKQFQHEHILEVKIVQEYIEFFVNSQHIHIVLSDIMNVLNQNQDQIIDINIDKSSLEERFITLTRGEE